MHRAAVLARVPKEWPLQTAMAARDRSNSLLALIGGQRIHLFWTLASAAGLGLAIFILYTFLNAGTKGHLAWPLRIASVAAFIVLCLGLLAIRGHLR
jgi:hypothetical protein